MKRFTLSALSVLLSVGAIAADAQALPQMDPSFKLQSLRLNELDTRNKSESDATFKLQSIRLGEFDARNKAEVDANFKLQSLRLDEFDARNKAEVDANFKLQSLRLDEFDARNKAEVDANFKLQSLRLYELDTRNKSEDDYYPYGQYQDQTPSQASQPETWYESAPAASAEEADLTETESAEAVVDDEANVQELSLIEQRHQLLDRD
ncbi:MAG: hypothetical protein AAFP20_01370 [Cyanobacteria bacterium J06614_10]